MNGFSVFHKEDCTTSLLHHSGGVFSFLILDFGFVILDLDHKEFWLCDPWPWSQWRLGDICAAPLRRSIYIPDPWSLVIFLIHDFWFVILDPDHKEDPDPWSWSQGRLWDICAAPLLRWGLSVQLPSQPAVVNAAENQKSNLKLAWDQMKDVIRDMRKIEKNVHTEKLGLHITWVTYIVNRILYEDLNNFGARFIS